MKPVLTPRHALPRVFLLRDLLVRQCRGRSKHAVFMARCESKGKRAFYFKTSLLKPVYDLVEFSFKLPLERSVPVIFSSMVQHLFPLECVSTPFAGSFYPYMELVTIYGVPHGKFCLRALSCILCILW